MQATFQFLWDKNNSEESLLKYFAQNQCISIERALHNTVKNTLDLRKITLEDIKGTKE